MRGPRGARWLGWMLLGLLVAGLPALAVHVHASDPPPPPEEETVPAALRRVEVIGPQVLRAACLRAVFALHPDTGRDFLYTVINGQPAMLAVVDAHTGEVTQTHPLRGAEGAWAMAASSDGSVYCGSYSNGTLYRYDPRNKQVETLGKPAGEQSHIWALDCGSDGTVYGGTYPRATLFSWSPASRQFQILADPVCPGENYIRSVAADNAGGRVFAGVGSHAHLVEYNLATRETREWLPERTRPYEFVYELNVAGDLLFAKLTTNVVMLVVDLRTRQVVGEVPGVHSAGVSPPAPDGRAFYNVGGRLEYWDTSTSPGQSRPVGTVDASVLGFGYLRQPGRSEPMMLAMFQRDGRLRHHPLDGGEDRVIPVELPGQPTGLQSLCRGPDGKLYSTGYLSGGLGIFDPQTHRTQMRPEMGQAEDIVVHAGKLYFGIYPHAEIMEYNPARPWNPRGSEAERNPRQLCTLRGDEQDRPFALLGDEDRNALYIGTIPGYGKLGGALSVYEFASKQLTVHRDVVSSQGIVALARRGEELFLGSTISGGLGIAPAASEARLAIWSLRENKVVFETVPVPGAPAITALLHAPDDTIWGVAWGTLFVFDPVKRTVIHRQLLIAPPATLPGHIWREAFLETAPDGSSVYALLRGTLFRINPTTRQADALHRGRLNLLALDRDGRVYFTDHETDLVRLRTPEE